MRAAPARSPSPAWSESGPCWVSREALFAMVGPHHPRIVPEIRDGRPAGFRVYGVRPGTITAALGLRDGDIVRAVNGVTLATPEQALEAYASVKRANEISYEVEREGWTLDLRCALR